MNQMVVETWPLTNFRSEGGDSLIIVVVDSCLCTLTRSLVVCVTTLITCIEPKSILWTKEMTKTIIHSFKMINVSPINWFLFLSTYRCKWYSTVWFHLNRWDDRKKSQSQTKLWACSNGWAIPDSKEHASSEVIFWAAGRTQFWSLHCSLMATWWLIQFSTKLEISRR